MKYTGAEKRGYKKILNAALDEVVGKKTIDQVISTPLGALETMRALVVAINERLRKQNARVIDHITLEGSTNSCTYVLLGEPERSTAALLLYGVKGQFTYSPM